MAKKSELDELATFFIPDNFINKGTLFGGLVKTRNFVEGAILAVVTGYPIISSSLSFTMKGVLSVIPLGLFFIGVFGINGGPLSQFLLDFFKFKKLTHTYLYESEKTKNIKEVDENEKA